MPVGRTLHGAAGSGSGPSEPGAESPIVTVGRYRLHRPIAKGGMATIHLGRLIGDAGFARTVAIKRLHPELTRDPEFVNMLLDEARLATRIRHPNVVPPLDVVSLDHELLVVMEYVEGESLSGLLNQVKTTEEPIPLAIVSGILGGALFGLHAAHEACSEAGEPLGIVHRDVSPQNILVGVNGLPRIIDFGVAKAVGHARAAGQTRAGQVKGKLAYMAPEQLTGQRVTRRTDLFAAGVVLWECLTNKRLFAGHGEDVALNVLEQPIEPPSERVSGLPKELDSIVLKALSRDPARRFATALEMAAALEAVVPPAPARVIGSWVEDHAAAALVERATEVIALERGSGNPDRSLEAPAALRFDPQAAVETVVEAVSNERASDGSLARLSGYVQAKQARPARSRVLRWAAVLALLAATSVVAVVISSAAAAPVRVLGAFDVPALPSLVVPEPVTLPAPPAESAGRATSGSTRSAGSKAPKGAAHRHHSVVKTRLPPRRLPLYGRD